MCHLLTPFCFRYGLRATPGTEHVITCIIILTTCLVLRSVSVSDWRLEQLLYSLPLWVADLSINNVTTSRRFRNTNQKIVNFRANSRQTVLQSTRSMVPKPPYHRSRIASLHSLATFSVQVPFNNTAAYVLRIK